MNAGEILILTVTFSAAIIMLAMTEQSEADKAAVASIVCKGDVKEIREDIIGDKIVCGDGTLYSIKD